MLLSFPTLIIKILFIINQSIHRNTAQDSCGMDIFIKDVPYKDWNIDIIEIYEGILGIECCNRCTTNLAEG